MAGLGATLLMEYVSSCLYARQAEETRAHEERLRPGLPTTVLVGKVADALGIGDELVPKPGTILHYAFGAGGGPAAILARRGVDPLLAGLAVAGAMELGADQAPGRQRPPGLTAPLSEFPLVAHVRGVAGHVVYGLALGLMLAAGGDR